MPGSSRPQVKAPTIRNVMDIKGPLRKGTLIHFTAKQWKQAIARIPEERRLPKHGLFLEAYPVPGEDVIAQPNCVPGPCEICAVRQRFGPGGEIIFDCRCRRDPKCPDDVPPPPPPQTGSCRLVIRRVGGFIRIFCESQGCNSPRGCRIALVRQGFRYVITCVCR